MRLGVDLPAQDASGNFGRKASLVSRAQIEPRVPGIPVSSPGGDVEI
jgi:hypothetical protein